MFTFSNPLLLWFLPILIIPWIFRRRQKERIQQVDFALMRFLRESEEKEMINPYLQELLLLILRTLLLACLILALAGPKWYSNERREAGLFSYLPFGKAFESKLVVLDTSYSMGYGEGESSWWNQCQKIWKRFEDQYSGFATETVRWDRTTVSGKTGDRLNALQKDEIENLFESIPTKAGTSVLDLVSAIRQNETDNESVIILTDGQKYPWSSLLNGSYNAASFPPVLVITVGKGSITNSWCEVSTLSTPPWGISGWETISGHVRSIRTAEEKGKISILRPETGEEIYTQLISFPQTEGQAASLPFLFTALYSDLAESVEGEGEPADELHFSIQVQPEDLLPHDNSLDLQVPCVDRFLFGIVCDPNVPPRELPVLSSALNPLADEPSSPPVDIRYITPEQKPYPLDIDLAIVSGYFATWWSTADSFAIQEYVKKGGSAVIFTGGTLQRSDDWKNFLEEIGWEWTTNVEIKKKPEQITANQTSVLGDLFDQWNEEVWHTWIPSMHGKLLENRGRSLITYQIDESTYSLISEISLGKGRIWLVNSEIDLEAETLLSPAFPVFLWETSKEIAREQQKYSLPDLPSRAESDLTLLTDEEKELLAERYGIRFADAETMDDAIAQRFGSIDLRLFLLFICLLFALTESWLSNYLASR